MSESIKSAPLIVLSALLLSAGQAWGGDSLYLVGHLEGRPLYWENRTNILDTLGMNDLGKRIFADDTLSSPDIERVASVLETRGKVIYKMNHSSSAAVAIAAAQGYTLFMLTQWGATSSDGILVSVPGMPVERKQQRIETDFLWESVDSAFALPREGVSPDFFVKFYFHKAGYCLFPAHDVLIFQPKPMIGTEGFVLDYQNDQYTESLMINRMVLGVYLLADAAVPKKKIEDRIEQGMDALKLDLSYKFESLIVVKGKKN